MLKKSQITEGDYIVLIGGTHCRVSKGWHGKDNRWLEVSYRHGRANVKRSIELSDISDIAPEPYTDPK